ncbi:DUF4139 domain-containing protein [Thermoflavimicrobium daqui]|uniref:DUF4139 domain-containing protein n=1 Tax=Thermoflavimicrobium daqui TaxID=2137476 RepID=A0A364K5J8_9BACL|nr:hypothetical protein [Thermoflavimicrobium daqui]RAL25563.1 hypothetical protein DL897_05595 [Thermoflavimicrobium daqui]
MIYTSTQKDCERMVLTIYNDGYGVIKETRSIALGEHDQLIHYSDIAEKIEIDSLLIDGLKIKEMNFEYDLVNKKKLLEKYVNEVILIRDRYSQQKTPYQLLSVTDSIIVQNTLTGEVRINPKGEMILPQLPQGFILKPSLIWKIKDPHQKSVNISYISKGFRWHASYIIYLQENTLDLSGWAHIHNESGATYENAELKLLAGKVHRIKKEKISSLEIPTFLKMAKRQNKNANFKEKTFHDYHLYTCQEKTTLKNNQLKQIKFVEQTKIPFQKYYMGLGVGPQKHYSTRIFVNLSNDHTHGLGIPLPKGKIKIYSRDTVNQCFEYLNETLIDHTSVDEKILLPLGEAFDVRMDCRIIKKKQTGKYAFITYEYTISNHRPESIHFKLNHLLYLKHMEWLSASVPFVKQNVDSYISDMNLAAGETKKVQVHIRAKVE